MTLWGLSPGMWCHVVCQLVTSISKETVASIFRVEKLFCDLKSCGLLSNFGGAPLPSPSASTFALRMKTGHSS